MFKEPRNLFRWAGNQFIGSLKGLQIRALGSALSESAYRGRVEIELVYLPSQLVRTPNFVMVHIVQGGGRVPPPPQPEPILIKQFHPKKGLENGLRRC